MLFKDRKSFVEVYLLLRIYCHSYNSLMSESLVAEVPNTISLSFSRFLNGPLKLH